MSVNDGPMIVKCWDAAADGHPTLNQHRVLCQYIFRVRERCKAALVEYIYIVSYLHSQCVKPFSVFIFFHFVYATSASAV